MRLTGFIGIISGLGFPKITATFLRGSSDKDTVHWGLH